MAIPDWTSNAGYYVIHQGLPIGSQSFFYVETNTRRMSSNLLSDHLDIVIAVTMGTGALVASRLEKGVWAALKEGLTRFAAPLALVFEIGLLIFAPYGMIDHVMNFAGWHYGIYLVSNWLVLIVASFLTAFGVRKRRAVGSVSL